MTLALSKSVRRLSSRSTLSRSPALACCMARSSRSRQAQSPNKTRSGRSLTRRRRPTPRRQPATAPGQPESFVFPVTVALDERSMNADGATIPLTPGMTGDRRNQDRLPPRHRLCSFPARQDCLRGGEGTLIYMSIRRDRQSPFSAGRRIQAVASATPPTRFERLPVSKPPALPGNTYHAPHRGCNAVA